MSAEEVRLLSYSLFEDNDEIIMKLILDAAKSGKFSIRMEQKDYQFDVEMVGRRLKDLGYNYSIEFFHGGYPPSSRILEICW